MTSAIIGVLFALGAAGVWGGGDFLGGFATRRNSGLLVLGITSITGLAGAVLLAGLTGEALPGRGDLGWLGAAAAAGVVGGVGLVALYRGLALGAQAGAGAAMVSPVAAVVGAIVPVLVGAWQEGLPKGMQLAGFGAGIAGIWLVTRAQIGDTETTHISDEARSKGYATGLRLAILAGLGFGGFFVLLAQVPEGHTLSGLAVTKLVEGLMAGVMLLLGRSYPGRFPEVLPRGGKVHDQASAVGAGVLDALGNVLYMLATNITRLDVAAVLVSMYPVGTVLLASAVLKEKVGRGQWLGVALCMVGVALITK